MVKKILSKYGASLYIDNDTILKYNSQLPNGPHAFVGVGSVSVADKTLPLNTVLYNNFKIDIGNMHYETDISDTGSVVKLKGTGFARALVPDVKPKPGVLNPKENGILLIYC